MTCNRPGSRKVIKQILGVLIVLAVVAQESGPARARQCRFQGTGTSRQVTFSQGAELGPALSPDGRMLAFEYFHPDGDGFPAIWVMDTLSGFKSAHALVDDGNYNSWPSWSPDSQWVSFVAKKRTGGRSLTSQIYKVRVPDGTLVQLTDFAKDTNLGDSTSWSRDGRIAFEYDDKVYVVGEAGGTPTELLDLKENLAPGTLWGIEWSPDDSYLTFRGAPRTSPEQRRIWVADSRGNAIQPVTEGAVDENPSWLDKSHILFERWVSGTDIRVCLLCLEALSVNCLTRGHPDVAPRADPTGRVIYFARGTIPKKEIHDRFFFQTHIYSLSSHTK